ncbi:MAG: sensor histidine kinase [Bryobacteraceae bacterium]
MFRRNAVEMRVVILAPIGRDAVLLASSLSPLEVDRAIATNTAGLIRMLGEGAGCAVIAEEALRRDVIHDFKTWLSEQPPWSDIPVVVLTFSGRVTRESDRRSEELEALGNVTLIERPVRPDTVRSAVRSALRARMRQYEIRSRQEALIQANADLEQFAHSASHDLREPLRSMSIYSEILTRKHAPSLDEEGTGYLNLIKGAALRMDNLLDDLLSYAHASSISDDVIGPVPAQQVVEAAVENLAGAIQESNAKINVGEMPAVRMRESHLAQIFQNLIGNALKYRALDRELEIQLSATQLEGHWVFCIADNGIGVPAVYFETIFGIFKRLQSNAASGTGMGLAICKRIVERYGGRIWVESEPGSGSKFLFSIPA